MYKRSHKTAFVDNNTIIMVTVCFSPSEQRIYSRAIYKMMKITLALQREHSKKDLMVTVAILETKTSKAHPLYLEVKRR
jgi:hypothetical protein